MRTRKTQVFRSLFKLGLHPTGWPLRYLTYPTIIVLALLLLVLWLYMSLGDQTKTVTLAWTAERYQVSDDFLGVAIDAAMLTDGDWWANSDSPPRPLAFDDDLLRWSRLLQPDWVRLGGTEADKLWLADDAEATPMPKLTHSQMAQFLAFTQAIPARPFITISTGPAVRQNGQWQSDQLERLLSWLPHNFNGQLEFGNEPGAHWLIFGRRYQIGFDQLAQEYQQAQRRVHEQNILLAGPANAFWPEIGEPLKQLFGSSKDFLQAGAHPDIFTWHYYPTQSSRCGVKTEGADWHALLDPETQQEFAKRSRIIQHWLRRYSPDSVQWLGETGPAQCGGKARLTDRFGASLWWLSHLGIAAANGNQTVIRQSLVGGDYALLRYHEGYSPNPDFWATMLWQRLMGPVGYRVSGQHGRVRASAHCHPTLPNRLTLLIVNMGDQPVNIALPARLRGRYLDVTSTALNSRYTFIGGQLAASLDWAQADAMPWQPTEDWSVLPAYAYRWVVIDDVTLCSQR